ncbi:NEDD4 family-interacting protein 1-like isoform X1 [Carcharodon carcharias]|uniref:NEDD4 family-interacting protein 1-like isoform X1 n=1 Tax=Carcharodon carcharias TaxID=13397 RepID=UPI001B7DF2B7|nr:NEDD4 family-interacting protein 1-like isoform X1 [Carcharodon carcharias]XP_041054581.1 NEDD4 family-interacting protein 1-like isoform X1 [Carcharodon carcharias]
MEFNGKPIIFCEYDDDFTLGDGYDDGNQLSLGNDGIFLLTFFIAFIFNWIGFFLSFCSTNTIAGRYGAISGFGLSLIKWILIVRLSRFWKSRTPGWLVLKLERGEKNHWLGFSVPAGVGRVWWREQTIWQEDQKSFHDVVKPVCNRPLHPPMAGNAARHRTSGTSL